VEILLWLLPPVAVTVVAMGWVTWLGRRGRREIDRDRAVRRLGEALSDEGRTRRPAAGYAAPAPQRDRSTGVAVRPSRVSPPREDQDEPERRRRVG
jgi:hypothetical protein